MMTEYKIGETFKYKTVELTVVESAVCKGCYFNYVASDCDEFPCAPLSRSDKKCVMAKLKQ